MRHGSYLRIAGGRRVFRRILPDDIAKRMGKREIIRSLGSVTHEEARRQARALTVATDRFIEMARARRQLTADELDQLARDGLAALYDELKSADAVIATVDSAGKAVTKPASRDAKRTHRRQEIAYAQETVAEGHWPIFSDQAVALLKEAGSSEDDDQIRELSERLARAFIQARKAEAAELDGNFEFEPADPLFKGAPLKAKRRHKLLDAWDQYRVAKTADRKWQIGQQRASKNAIELLERWIGNKPVDRYARSDLLKFVDMLRTLPANHGKAPSTRGLELDAIIALGQKRGLPTLTPTTIFKHVTQLGAFFDWCIDQEWISKNPAKGVYKKPKKVIRAKDERAAWSDAHIVKMFMSPLWTGARNTTHRATPGDVIQRDAKYWIPLILAYHNARLEEIAQLRVADIKTENGIVYFDITTTEDDGEKPKLKSNDPDKKIKSQAGHRKLPIHSALVELGFLDHVAAMKVEREARVFPRLHAGGPERRFGYSITKWFSNYRHSIRLPKALTLHGLRHTVETRLVHALVDRRLVDQIAGHETPGMSSRYTDRFPLDKVTDATEKVRYPDLDIGKLRTLADAARKK